VKAASLFGLLTILFASGIARAGPPFRTDDPEPIDYRNYEFYTFATSDGTGVETDPAGPAIEFNYGVLPNVHLHIIVPMAAILPSNNPRYAPSGTGPNEYGIGDIETGIKPGLFKRASTVRWSALSPCLGWRAATLAEAWA
jgi:hypothetical protein